jgi:hypothetical protein
MYQKGLNFLNQIKGFLDERDKTIIQDMSDLELEKFLIILEEYINYGQSKEFEKIENADYIRTPVSIETFLDDPSYIGEVGKNVYPKLREDLIAIFDNPNLVEIILSGSIGWGKSHMSKIIAMYILYTISCLRNPQEFFGITPGTPIVLCNLSLSVKKSDEFFTDIRNMLDSSPYFKKYFNRLPRIKSSLVFPNQVMFISAGSQESGIIGSNVIFCIMDEVNFMQRSKTSKKRTSETEEYNQALELYNAILSRLYSRFMYYGKTMGKVVIISSKRYPNDFLEEHIKKSRGNKNVFILDYATWDVKDKSQFSGKWFHVYVGDGLEKPRILDDKEDIKKLNSDTIIKVPEEYRRSFEMNLLRSIRDIAGISILGTNLFIYNSDKVKEAFDTQREIPATGLKTNLVDGFQLKKEVLFNLSSDGTPIAFKKFPNMPRFIHVDLSKNDCDTGFAMGCFGGYKAVNKVGLNGIEYIEQLPITWIDLAISIGVDPELSEINQNRIKDFIKSIYDLGINIKKVSTDRYQNLGLKQGLLEVGLDATELSTVTNLEPYIELKNSIITGRFNCHPQPVARKEVTTLEKDRVKNVVDHPPNGSKDVADCLAAICYWVSKEHVYMEDVIPEKSGIISNFYGETSLDKLNNAEFFDADLDSLTDEDRFMRQILL